MSGFDTAGRPRAQGMRIACIGEAMVEVKLAQGSDQAWVGFAGDVLNTAIYLRRCLPPPHEVAFVSVIGRDDLSDRMAATVADEGISTDDLTRHPTRTLGLYTITTDARGERAFCYWRDSSAARTLFQGGRTADFTVLDGFDCICLSAITLAILPETVRLDLLAWLAAFRGRGGLVAFDSNYRARLWSAQPEARAAIEVAWRCCDIGLPSADDERAVFGEATDDQIIGRLRHCGVKRGALKRGHLGPLSLAGTKAGPFPEATQVVDTTAAGDSFNGGYLAAVLSGAAEADALRAGHACARRVVGYPGAIVPRHIWAEA